MIPTCWVIAGPNGAGKTTFALDYLPQIAVDTHFINADLIASGLSPLSPEKKLLAASRLFLAEINQSIANRTNFAFETTLSGRTYLQLIDRLRGDDWRVELIFLALPSVELSIERVAERVALGGHNIPTSDIVRRFPRSLNLLLKHYSYVVDDCACYMNFRGKPELVFEQQYQDRYIYHDFYFKLLERNSK